MFNLEDHKMIIGVSGKIGSGKDTFLKRLKEKGVHLYVEAKFSKILKEMSAVLTGVEDQYSHKGKQTYIESLNMTVGEFQQRLGEGMKQEVHPLVWVNAVLRELDPYQNYVITDLRYRDEASSIYLSDHADIFIRINGNWNGIEKLREGRDMNHRSETDLDNWTRWDAVIENNTTEEEFLQKVDNVIKQLNL